MDRIPVAAARVLTLTLLTSCALTACASDPENMDAGDSSGSVDDSLGPTPAQRQKLIEALGPVPHTNALHKIFLERTKPLAAQCEDWGGFIVLDGELVHVAAPGDAGPDDPVLLASLSKTLMVILTFRLVAAGKLDLDTPVMKIFAKDSELTLFYELMLDDPHQAELTTRLLLSHRGGLATDGTFGNPSVCVEDPDTNTRYSNMGYQVLYDVVRVAGGGTLPGLIYQQVAKPAGAAGFGILEDRNMASTQSSASARAFGMVIAALLNGTLIAEPTWPDTVLDIQGGKYAHGFQVQVLDGKRLAMQEGSFNETRATLTMWDETRDGIGLFCRVPKGKKPVDDMRSMSWSIIADAKAL